MTQPHDSTGQMVVEPRPEFMRHQDSKEFFQILDDTAGTVFGWINHEHKCTMKIQYYTKKILMGTLFATGKQVGRDLGGI